MLLRAAIRGLSPYGNVNNLRLSGVKSYMGMLGMLRAESLAITHIMIWNSSTQERLFLLLLLLILLIIISFNNSILALLL